MRANDGVSRASKVALQHRVRRERTVKIFSLVVSNSAFKHVSKKSTWSRRSWSTVSTFSSLPSSARQLGSRTSPTAKLNICCTNANILARRAKTRPFHFSSSGYRDRTRQMAVLVWSVQASARRRSRSLSWRRYRKMSWYRRIVFFEMTRLRGNRTR